MRINGIITKKRAYGPRNKPSRNKCKCRPKSSLEKYVCDYLYRNDIPHSYEPKIPYMKRGKADFFALGIYIEVFGVKGSKNYDSRRKEKQEHYRKKRISYIEIFYTNQLIRLQPLLLLKTKQKNIILCDNKKTIDQDITNSNESANEPTIEISGIVRQKFTKKGTIEGERKIDSFNH